MRNITVVLSGGTGTRLGAELPKQYIRLLGKPILVHTLEQLQRCEAIDGILVAADPAWQSQILQWKEAFSLRKLLAVTPSGKNRQHSIRNGLLAAEEFIDNHPESGVLIQDAVRPLTSTALLTQLLAKLQEAPCVMPALPITDTVYTSLNGQWVDGLLDRSRLFAGQAPEAFRFWPYLALYRDAPEESLSALSGSCQLPYSQGWHVKMIPGELENMKITYPNDFELSSKILHERDVMP